METLKNNIKKIVLKTRPDLERQLLFSDSEIYNLMMEKASKMNITLDTEDNVQKVWTYMNLENPIPHLTAELDLIFEENYMEIKMELLKDEIYEMTLIQIGEIEECTTIYEKYNYFNISEFAYSDEFENELEKVIGNYCKKFL